MLKVLKAYFQHPQSLIIGIGFASLSLLMSTFAIRLPELKALLQINDAQLGTAWLILSAASLAISPFSSFIIDKIGTGKAVFISVLLQTLFYILPLLASEYWLFLIAMFLLGLANGFITVSLNAAAAIVEKVYHRSIMSSCHGLFSLGAIIGAGSAGLIASLNVSPMLHIASLIILILIANISLKKVWLSIPETSLKAPLLVIPKRPILAFVIITFCIVLAELTIMDWSAVYLSDTLQSPAILTGLGFAGFSLTMAIGRLFGDHWIAKTGKVRSLLIGCLLAGLGLSITAFTKTPWIAIAGFTITGLGMATIVPLIYSLSAKMKEITPAVGIASIATACILSGLVGRPLVGTISEAVGMSVSLWMAAGFSIFAAGVVLLAVKK